jgi:ech hydrogenase subunit D
MKDSVVVLTEDNTPQLLPNMIISQIRLLKDEGFRFVTMSSNDLGDSICVLYHLDKDLQLINLKVEVPKGSKIPSICSVYASAVLIENEIKEHFGVNFDGLSIDFQGMLYLDEEVQKTPFCKIGITRV